jgi:hypothetical protein
VRAVVADLVDERERRLHAPKPTEGVEDEQEDEPTHAQVEIEHDRPATARKRRRVAAEHAGEDDEEEGAQVKSSQVKSRLSSQVMLT